MNYSDDSDDYDLPSLSERVQFSLKSQHTLQVILTSDSETEESDFRKVSKRNHSTPHPQIKCKTIFSSYSDDDIESPKQSLNGNYIPTFQNQQVNHEENQSDSDESFSNILKTISLSQTPATQNKKVNHKENQSDSDESFSNILKAISLSQTHATQNKQVHHEENQSDSDDSFSNILKTISLSQTPAIQNKQVNHKENQSDSDGSFSNILKSISLSQTPATQNKQVNHEENQSDSDGSFSNILKTISLSQTPATQNKQRNCEANELDSSGSFSNILKNIRQTPIAQNKQRNHEANESDSSDSFSNILENISIMQTPASQRKKIHHEESGGVSDGTFSDVIEKMSKFYTPKPQNKNGRNFLSSNDCDKPVFSTPREDALHKSVFLRVSNEKEYAALFPPKSTNLSATDQAIYGQKLFKFFNEKIFSSQFPADMPLVWSNSLLSSAGVTDCKRRNGTRSCLIRLSSKLLTTFDRLQDTLLHEMCHAAVWMISKAEEQHGPLWKTWASRCKLILPFVECPERCHNYDVPYRVLYQCLNCNWKVGRCRQSQKYHGLCKKCKAPVVMTTL